MTSLRIGALLDWFQNMIYNPSNLCLFYHLLHKHDLYIMEYKAVFQYDYFTKNLYEVRLCKYENQSELHLTIHFVLQSKHTSATAIKIS